MLVITVIIASLGLLAHNLLSLPLPLVAPENIGPLIVYGGLLAWLHVSPGVRARAALMLWSAVNLVVGGILTVLPLPILPFVPEQTPGHYVAHAIYAMAQVPLLWLLIRSPRVLAVV